MPSAPSHFLPFTTRDTRFPFAVAFDPLINPTLFAIAYFSRSPPGRDNSFTCSSKCPSFVSFPRRVLNGISPPPLRPHWTSSRTIFRIRPYRHKPLPTYYAPRLIRHAIRYSAAYRHIYRHIYRHSRLIRHRCNANLGSFPRFLTYRHRCFPGGFRYLPRNHTRRPRSTPQLLTQLNHRHPAPHYRPRLQ